MNEIYIVDGQEYSVGQSRLEEFLEKFPNAIKKEEEETYTSPSFELDDPLGSIWKIGGEYIDAITTGWETGRTNEENLEVFKGSTSLDDIEAMIVAGDKLNNLPQGERMKRFQKKVEEDGGGFFAALRALVFEDPILASQIATQSMSMMAGALVDSGADVLEGKTGDALGYVGAGAGIGALTFGTLGSIAPGIGNLIGAGTGAIAGSLGGLSTAMEHGLTFAELLKEEMEKDGKEWNKESIKQWLEEGDNYQKVKNRALRRGLTIGAIDMLSGGLAGAVTTKTVKALAKTSLRAGTRGVIAAGTGIGTEGAFGGVGEFFGQKAADQEYDASEIIMEAFAQTPGAVVTSLPKIFEKRKYKIGTETLSEEKFKKEIEAMDDITIAMADITIENDDVFAAEVYERQNKAIIDSQIDHRVTDQNDREKLIDLEIQRTKAQVDVKKEGSQKVPKAKETLESIENEIESIVNKYEGAKSTELLLQEEDSAAKRVALAVGKKRLKGTIEFAEKAAGALGMEYVDAGETAKSFLEKYKEVVGALNASQEDKTDDQILMSDGLIVKGNDGKSVVLINKERAALTGAISVGSHEVLHAVLNKHLKGLDPSARKELVTSFKDTLKNNLDSKAYKAIEDRMNFYKKKLGDKIDLETTDEWFTAFSDAIVKGEIKYNETLFDKIIDLITPMLRAMGFKKIKFNDGKQAFNFIKEYSKNARKGNLVAGVSDFAGKIDMEGSALSITEQNKVFTPQDTAEESLSDLVDKVNEAYKADASEDKSTAGFEIAMMYEGQANSILNRYIETADLTEDQKNILESKREDIVSMLLYDKIPTQKAESKHRTALGLVQDFRKEKHKYENVAAYLNQFLKERAKEVFKYFLPEAFVKSTAEETISKKVSKKIATQTADMTVDKKDKPLPKVERQRELEKLADITIESKEQFIQDLKEDILQVIELNPANVNNVIKQLIKGGINKKVMDMMGKVSKVTGVSEQYKVFHDTHFDFIQKSIPTSEIKKRYGKLFKIINTGKRDATPQGNDIFIIKPIPRAQFGAYFTVGPAGRLIERKRSLAQVLTKGLITKVANDLTIENSNNPDAVFKASLENILQEFDKQRGELAKQDQVSLSLSVEKSINIIEELANIANEKGIEAYEKSKELNYAKEYHPQLVKIVDRLVYENPEAVDGAKGFIKEMERLGIPKELSKPIAEKQLQWSSEKTGPNTDLQKNYEESINKVQEYIPGVIFEAAGFDWMGYKDQGRGVQPLTADQKKQKVAKNKYQEIEGAKYSTEETRKAYNEFIVHKDSLRKQVKTKSWFKDVVWNGILAADISVQERKQKLGAAYNDMLNINKANMALLKYLALKLNVLHKAKVIDSKYLYVMGQLQTNIIEGFRAFSTIKGLYLAEGKGKIVGMMSPRAITKNTKAVKDLVNNENISEENALLRVRNEAKQEYRDSWKDCIEYKERYNANKKDPKYKRNAVDKNGNPKYLTDQDHIIALELATIHDLNYKNEHMGPNALTMAELMNTIITSDIKTIAQAEAIFSDHETLWAPNYITDIMDKVGGKVTTEGRYRIKFLPKGKMKNAIDISGDPMTKVIAREGVASLSITQEDVNNHNIALKAEKVSLSITDKKGISIWDFDDTLARTNSKILYTTPDGKKGKLNAEQYARDYVELAAKGYVFDFSEFNKVVQGREGPFFKKALERAKKFGTKNQFILTARPPESQLAIHEFLKGLGLNIPLQNITGLANSTSEAKALWITEKVSEGYNDIYFADDALQNVQAVQNVLDQFDVKSKVQLAKEQTKLSLSDDLNKIIELNEGIDATTKISGAQARLQGAQRTKNLGDRFFNTAGSNDFMGLMYVIANAKGKLGEQQIKFFEDNLYKPYRKGVQRINNIKQNIADNYKTLLKSKEGVRSKLRSVVPGTNFTHDAAVRVYLWEKSGFETPDISPQEKQKLIKAVLEDNQLRDFADQLGVISLQPEGYTKPGENWAAETILSDLDHVTEKVARKVHLQEFLNNKDIVFSKENLNKLEAVYGPEFVEALKDMLYRMENGNNRPTGQNGQVNKWLNWVSNSIGAIMFFNTRSALLQTLSTANFINWGDNNPIKAAMALANFPRFIKDFTMIFNSDFLRQRRGGLKLDVNEAALANAVAGKKNKPKAMIAYLLKIGFLPTQIADSFAIAAGGATFYRNRINTYKKQGLSQQQAEAKAFEDMVDSSEPVQQSADPSLISKEQASILGRVVLAFQNVTMQYSRRMKKSVIDIAKGRGDLKTNISRIVYYGAVQNFVFNALQSALFALAFDDEDEDDKKKNKRTVRVANGMADSILRGLGVSGAVVATVKNAIMEYQKQRTKGYNEDQTYTLLQMLNISPPIGSKARKIYSATQTEKFNKKIIAEMSMYDISNPRWQSIGSVVEGVTNIPMSRVINKINNIKQSMDEDNAAWQRIALILGWNTWDLGVTDSDVLKIKEEVKKNQKSNQKNSGYKRVPKKRTRSKRRTTKRR